MGSYNVLWSQSGPLAPVLAWLIAASAFHVACELPLQVRTQRGLAAAAWYAAGGAALASGLWAVHILGTMAAGLPYEIGYSPMGLLATWVATAFLGFLGLGLATGKPAGKSHRVLAGLLVGAGLVLLPLCALASADLRPKLSWYTGPVAMAAITSGLGGVAASFLAFRLNDQGRQWLHRIFRAAASGVVATAATFAQQQVMQAANLDALTGSGYVGLLPTDVLLSLACVGVPAILALLAVVAHLGEQISRPATSLEPMRERGPARDALTRLPNAAMFEGTLTQAVQRVDETGERIALLLVDMDGFGAINQNHGVPMGDRVLREAAKRLRDAVPGPGTLARLREDKFLVLMLGNPHKNEAMVLANRLREAVAAPFRLAGKQIQLSCSIGIVMYPEHGALSTLISHVESAVRASKTQGGSTYAFYDSQLANRPQEQVSLLRDLREALSRGQLELYYQPKIHAPSGEITGAEALMRWHHPQRGMISPAVFIPIAERFGLISALGRWLIDESCLQVRLWRESGLRMRLAINLSVYQLREVDLVDCISAALKRNDIDPKLLTCEITESMAMDDAETTKAVFGSLKRLGVHISIDDFGTGASSLSQLRKLRPEELKIDRSFVLDLATSNDARAVVDAVVKLAHALSIKVVAEGVETEPQHQVLRSLGCHELQGYLFAKPMSAKALAAWAMSDDGPRSISFRESLFVTRPLPSPRKA